ncbi:MAG: hypothetical protein P8011_00115 [Acidihalobacter sp.]|uniref:hypothetical protein n=1 Tax=Acidihalobacter sp. TaxID=1872108 RepID=UPI00307E914A
MADMTEGRPDFTPGEPAGSVAAEPVERMEAAIQAASIAAGDEGQEIERKLRRLAHEQQIPADDPLWAAFSMAIEVIAATTAAELTAAETAERAAAAGEAVAEKLTDIPERMREGARAAGDDLARQIEQIVAHAVQRAGDPAAALGREIAAEIGRSRAALINDIKTKRKEVVEDWRSAAVEAARAEVRSQAAGRRALTWLIAPAVFLAGLTAGLGVAWESGYLLSPGDRVQVVERTPRGPVLGLSGGIYRWSGDCSETLCIQIHR